MSSSTDDRIPVGYVRRAHGIRGDVLVRPLTDHPERFAPDAVFLTEEDPPRTLEVRSVRGAGADLIISFAGLADRTEAETLRGQRLTIGKSERRELDEGEYWPDELEGLVALDPHGDRIGVVTGDDLPPDYGDSQIFGDGFESGDLGSWSGHQP